MVYRWPYYTFEAAKTILGSGRRPRRYREGGRRLRFHAILDPVRCKAGAPPINRRWRRLRGRRRFVHHGLSGSRRREVVLSALCPSGR